MFKLIYFIFILNIFCCVKNVYSLNCTSCSSVTDSYCTTFNFPAGINGLPSIQCEESVTQCYEEFNNEGLIFRGCGPPPTPTCIAGVNCFTCNTDNCNGNIIPANRHQCQQCEGSQCSITTAQSPCLLTTEDFRCYSHVNGNQARKGCASDPSFVDVQIGCEDTNFPNCQMCTGINCNSVIIAENICYNCNTTANPFCLTSPGQPTSCFGLTQSPCYVSIDEGVERVHGCLSTLSPVEAQQCPLAGQTTCKSCVGELCNGRLEFLECLNCNGNINCGSTLDIPNQRCSRLNDECIVHVNQGNTIRGCLLEQTAPIQTDCTNLQLCNRCDGVGCNNLVIENLNCITCNSNAHPNCNNITDEALSVSCGTLTVHRSCYLRRTQTLVERGCITNLSGAELTECFESSDTCKRCIGDNCNAREFTTCHACDSTTNVNCAILEEDLDGGNVNTCRNMTDTCRVFVDIPTGVTVRGCSEDSPNVPCGPTMAFCSECEGENCNANLFPENRARCHQCIGPHCSTIETAIQRTCSIFSLAPQCFAFIDENLITHRGCLHDDPILMQTCQSMSAACFQCSPSVTHNCNTIQTINAPALSCIQCNNTEQCAWGHEFESAVPCTDNVIFPHIEQCFTYEDAEGDIVRGCQLDDTRCDLHDTCERCVGTNGCNNANRITSTCIQCRSSLNDNQDCVNADTAGFERECETPFYTYENRGCYTLRESDGTIVRGCASDLDAELRAECIDENSACNLCLENVCNNNEAPSDGNALVNISFITLIFICVFGKIIN